MPSDLISVRIRIRVFNLEFAYLQNDATIIKQTCPKLVCSVEQRKALELKEIVEEKCPIEQRDGLSRSEALKWTDLGQDTVYLVTK